MTADQRQGVWILIAAAAILPCPERQHTRCGTRPQRLTLAFRFPRLSLVGLQSCLSHNRQATLGDIFLAIDRPDMRGVSIAIGASDPKLLLVRIDPLPQLFADRESLQTGLALDAHEIDGKPQNLNVGSISFRGSLNGSGK